MPVPGVGGLLVDQAPEPIGAGCILLLHGDGAQGSTTITDSATGKAVTAGGNAIVDQAQTVFGTGSIKFDGTGDFLSIPASADFDFGTGPFTMDFWCRNGGTPVEYDGILTTRNSAGSNYKLLYFSQKLFFQHGSITIGDDTVAPLNVWQHYAIVRNGTSLLFYRNGVLVDSAVISSGQTFNTAGSGVNFGRADLGVANGTDFWGWLEEVHIQKGVARWTANFDPPSQPYG